MRYTIYDNRIWKIVSSHTDTNKISLESKDEMQEIKIPCVKINYCAGLLAIPFKVSNTAKFKIIELIEQEYSKYDMDDTLRCGEFGHFISMLINGFLLINPHYIDVPIEKILEIIKENQEETLCIDTPEGEIIATAVKDSCISVEYKDNNNEPTALLIYDKEKNKINMECYPEGIENPDTKSIYTLTKRWTNFDRLFYDAIPERHDDIIKSKIKFTITYEWNGEKETDFLLDGAKISTDHIHFADNVSRIKNALGKEWENFCIENKIPNTRYVKLITANILSD